MYKRKTMITLMLLLASLLLLTSGVYATLKFTDVIHSWDDGFARYETGNAAVYLDGSPQPFYIELGFDDNPVVDACGIATSTQWAGPALIGLYHTDTDADNNAPGFQSTADWSFVPCSAFDTKKYPDPGDVLYTCTTDNGDDVFDRCEIVSQDVVTPCTTGNCKDEIVTGLKLNLDTNCDGALDAGFDGSVCLYWTAEKPPFVAPFWEGNFQVRVGDASTGGDKTINFDFAGPNALSLGSLTANSRDSVSVALLISVLGLLLTGAGLVFVRKVVSPRP